MQRIDKLLAHALSISRSDVMRLIRARRITLEGQVIKSGSDKVPLDAPLLFDERPISLTLAKRYFMLNKPEGYVCANSDPSHPNVTSLLDEPSAHLLHAAGRLDVDTTGLVLLTDDGNWSHKITSPKKQCPKTYHVTLKHPLQDNLIELFAKGILLKQEKNLTAPAHLTILNEYEALLEIYEGKYHQVKRMFAACQNRVIALKRLQIGPIKLDSALALGEYRALEEDEILSIMGELN